MYVYVNLHLLVLEHHIALLYCMQEIVLRYIFNKVLCMNYQFMHGWMHPLFMQCMHVGAQYGGAGAV